MLALTFFPDGTTTSSLLLCNTSRSLTELDVKFNHRRVLTIEHLATVLGSGRAGLAQDFANHRHTLSLKVRRSVDFSATPVPFADPEAALLFALDQPALFTTTGALKIQVTGTTTNATRWLLNCGVERIQLADWLGIAPAFAYTFNGGLITATAPF